MLFGEHAVLHGSPAIATAVDQYISVNLTPRNDQQINIHSDRLGHYQTTIDSLTITKPFTFILAVISQYKPQLNSGFDLSVHSEFADTLGLGSSAAVTVATLSALHQWLHLPNTPMDLYLAAKQAIITVQGAGSGADAAASAFSGVIAFQVEPLKIEPLPQIPAISLVYSGYKTPTKEVIAKVAKQHAQFPPLYEQIYSAMGQCTKSAINAIKQQQWETLAQLIHIYQGLMQALGVSTPQLNQLINNLAAQPNMLGAKISGSGLGDCIWGLGSLAANTFPLNQQQQDAGVQQIDIALSPSESQ